MQVLLQGPPLLWAIPPELNLTDSLIEVVVGNRCSVEHGVERNKFKWTMYVLLPGFQESIGRMIEKVQYELHETFTPRLRTCSSPPFELSCKGWGTFPIKCTIFWNPRIHRQPTEIVHELVFEDEGARSASTIGVAPQALRLFQRSRSARAGANRG